MTSIRTRLILAICLLTAFLAPGWLAASEGTVLITGANRGIGLGMARKFAAEGYTVIGTARKPASADDLNALDVRVEQLDVTDADSVSALAERIGDTPIDILINNAGIKGQDQTNITNIDVEAINIVLDVNVLGPIRVIQALFDNVQASERKTVANISSMMGSMELNTWGCCIDYRASKAALNNITSTLAVDNGKQGMVFVTLHPGYVQTDMNNGNGAITTTESAEGLFKVITGLTTDDNGAYFDWKGEALPW